METELATSILSSTKNFETVGVSFFAVLSNLEMWCGLSFVLSRPSFQFATRSTTSQLHSCCSVLVEYFTVKCTKFAQVRLSHILTSKWLVSALVEAFVQRRITDEV